MMGKLNVYEKLFLYLYISTTRTNKSIPDWSTTIFLSTVTTLYAVSFGILSPFDMVSLGRNGFMLLIVVSIFIHWFYFLKNGRVLKKFKTLKPKTNLTGQIFTKLYSFGGFAFTFYVLGLDWIFTLFLALIFGAVELSSFLFGSKPIKFQ